jgi:pimeloyl-ACP methyl ester carboxylesterase
MTAAPINGLTIEYDEHGDPSGDPLLLVMGLGAQLIAWPLEFVDRLTARGFRVIRFDNRDIGLSTKIDAPPPTLRQLLLAQLSPRFAKKAAYRLADMADDAAGLLTYLSIDRAHVVGASMGGMIVQTMAIDHPDKVATMTSIMSNTGDRKHGRIAGALLLKLPRVLARSRKDPVAGGVELGRLISGPTFDPVQARELIEAALARCDDPDGTARQSMAVAASPDRTPGLRHVTAPTLVIHGLVDPLVKPDGGMATAEAVPGARLLMYPDMGHDLPENRWDEMVEAIAANARRVATV